MLDIKWIRENPDLFDEKMKKRGLNEPSSGELLALDQKKREMQTSMDSLLAKRNKLAKDIAITKKENKIDLAKKLQEEAQIINELIKNSQDQYSDKLNDLLSNIPNIIDDSVPYGVSEEENVEIERWGKPKEFNFKVKTHFELGEELSLLDVKKTSNISGARFSTLLGSLARLERALSNFMLDVACENGYIEISPPTIVKSEAMFGSGQLPKFFDEAFAIKESDFWLIPTSEVSLVNMVANQKINLEELPIRYTASTVCYRKEAGSAGKDTQGIIRQHQFKKVELVSIISQEESVIEHEKMTNIACSILKKLGLPYRKILLCSGDTGFCSSKTYDIEVWLPSQNKYREISSCSNCTDFQARRIGAKYEQNKNKYFVHTLNGSSLAIGRTIVAILENYQESDGSVTIPDILVEYMGGTRKL